MFSVPARRTLKEIKKKEENEKLFPFWKEKCCFRLCNLPLFPLYPLKNMKIF